MTPIVSLEYIRNRARKDFADGLPCRFPPHSAAARTWYDERANLIVIAASLDAAAGLREVA